MVDNWRDSSINAIGNLEYQLIIQTVYIEILT